MAAMMDIICETAPPSEGRVLKSPRQGRQSRERNRVAAMIVSQIARQPGMIHIGDDPLTDFYLVTFGIDPADLVVCQILFRKSPVTIMAVPSRIWRKPERMGRVLRAKRSLAGHGRYAIAVPQAAIAGDIAGLASVLKRGSTSPTASCSCGEVHDPVGCAAMAVAGTVQSGEMFRL